MPFDPGPLIAGLALLAASTWIGIYPVVKIIKVYEAKHELKQGSAGWLRSISGWSVIAFWLMTTWFCATVIGDWGASGDLAGAIDRSWLRLRILLEIAAALGDFGLMAGPEARQSELQCPTCAGQRVFSPATTGLKCESCGATETLAHEDDHEAAREFDYDPSAAPDEVRVESDGHVHACRTCGGEVVFTGRALSNRCPYCDGPVVLGGADSGYHAMALIPFRVVGEDALAKARSWVARRVAAPSDLSSVVQGARVAGLYAPFWTFDCQEAVQYWAKYTTGSGDSRRTHSVSGSLNITFDDLLMPASPHVTPLIRDGILHEFDPRRLRPYRTGYLAGFAAERHHQTVAQGLAANLPDKRLLIRNRIKRHIARSRVRSIRFQTDTTGIRYRRILVPVWMLHYQHGGKPYKVVVSGMDGRTFGERPFSRLKLAAYSAAISGLAMVFGLFWGASGFL